MEVQARIELALLAMVLNPPGQARAGGSPGSHPASWPGEPVDESEGLSS